MQRSHVLEIPDNPIDTCSSCIFPVDVLINTPAWAMATLLHGYPLAYHALYEGLLLPLPPAKHGCWSVLLLPVSCCWHSIVVSGGALLPLLKGLDCVCKHSVDCGRK